MAWKINKISIENFKFFLEPFVLEPKGKNVLIYGENGSGKSSIYWAAYTHFQSSLKDVGNAQKYFNKDHRDSLCNLYASNNRRSGIEIEFVDPNDIKRTYTDGNWAINTSSDEFMKHSTFASDFMNYKFLSAIFDFKNSKPVDLFKIFEEEIFPFVTLNGQCYNLTGVPMGRSGVEDWWRYIKYCYETTGVLNKRSETGNVYNHDETYQAYQNLISDFNLKLQSLLFEIAEEANKKLKESKMPISVSLRLEPVAFDKKIEGTTRSYDGTFYNPQIILTVQLLDANGLPVSDKEINHPRSFFNEAKLTRIALALRLAIFDRKYSADDCAKVIFVDDLLISLDMSNRLLVVRKLLDYVDRYQLFIFTHDRTFYDLIYDSISQRNANNEWRYYEMYAVDEVVSVDKVPSPWVNVKRNYLQQARAFFTNYEYHASANSLRKECEKQLKRLYPQHWINYMKKDGSTSELNLNALIQKLEKFYERYDFKMLPTPNIDQYRKRILNPSSHNDNKAKIFRSELILAIDEISKFEKIQKKLICGYDDICEREFVMELDFNDKHVIIEFTPKEVWNMLFYDNQIYYEDIKIDCRNLIGIKLKANKEHSVLSVWKRVCNYLGYDDNAYPAMCEVVREKNTGIFLKDL